MAQAEVRSLVQPRSTTWTAARAQKLLRTALIYAVLVAGSVVFTVPFLWMISSSLKTQVEVFVFPPRPLPKVFHWENYPNALTAVPFGRYFLNSLFVSGMVVVGTVLSSSMVGYGFARVRGWGRNALFAIVLATMMLPNQVTMISPSASTTCAWSTTRPSSRSWVWRRRPKTGRTSPGPGTPSSRQPRS